MSVYAGWQRRLVIAAEATWATTPASPVYIPIPYATYNVKAQPQAYQAQLHTGMRQRRHNRVTRIPVAGQLACPLYGIHVQSKSIAQWLIDWATDAPSSLFGSSKLAELYEGGTDDKRHNGLRVNQMTLASDPSTGAINITLDLIGKTETGGITPQALDQTQPQPVEFIMADATFTLGGSAVELESFSIVVNNNLQPRYLNGSAVNQLSQGVRAVDYQLQLLKTDNTYDALCRSIAINNQTGQLTLKGRHQGTASNTYTRIVIDFDRLNFASAVDQFDLNGLVAQQVNQIALKPDTTDNEIDFTFDTI